MHFRDEHIQSIATVVVLPSTDSHQNMRHTERRSACEGGTSSRHL